MQERDPIGKDDMQHAPTENEKKHLAGMTATQRIEYFLTRTMESEEVWGLTDDDGWLLRDRDGKTVLQIWPYRQFVEECIELEDQRPGSVSLEHFVDSILETLLAQDIVIELWPDRERTGTLLTATEMQDMFTSLFDSGEYRLEG
jgi:hypothetical protein